MSCKKETTREHILDLSYSLFAEKGFKNVTMKDVCEVTNLSRGGLYSHFSSTASLFEAILYRLNQKDEMNFFDEMEQGTCAVDILNSALALMENEMNNPKDSLSLAMYEYADSVEESQLNSFNDVGKEKWISLVQYGIERGEFNSQDVDEIVNVILYVYQGVRMWSCIVDIDKNTVKSIMSNIRKQLIK